MNPTNTIPHTAGEMEKDSSSILLISDLAGYGKVATAAMLPILSYMEYQVFNLPTMLISNTFRYPKSCSLDTTEYIQQVLPVWKELGFHFDAIATGYMVSVRQARIVADYCKEQAALGTAIYVDPVMGDSGKLYNGVTDEAVRAMREMISVADLIYPNYTEACYLTDTPYKKDGVTEREIHELIDGLRKTGARSVIITSLKIKDEHSGQHAGSAVAGYNADNDEFFLLPYTEIPTELPGTGDIFSAVLIAHLLHREPLRQCTQKAMDAVYQLIELSRGLKDKNCGIPLENYLHVVK